jgi:hypothetical protein
MPKMPKTIKKTTGSIKEPKMYYIVMSQAMEYNYNDEIYYPAAGGECGVPQEIFENANAAKKSCDRLNAARLKRENLFKYCESIYELISEESVDAFKRRYKKVFGEETRLFDKPTYHNKGVCFPENATIEQVEKFTDLIDLQFYYVAGAEMEQ